MIGIWTRFMEVDQVGREKEMMEPKLGRRRIKIKKVMVMVMVRPVIICEEFFYMLWL